MKKEKKPIAEVYYFDCWKRDGHLKTKRIIAANENDAIILFKGKYPDYAFDKPYF